MTLTDPELTRMQTVTERYLPDTAVIQGGTLVSDGGGGYTGTFGNRGTVPARIAPLGGMGAEGQIGGRISAEADVLITLPADTDVTTDDRIVIGDSTYDVVMIRTRSWETTRRVECKEVE